MDPDANLQEQERILAAGARGPANRVRLFDLREALWAWLKRRGHEPRWSECPRAAVHFKEYGGSNVAGWKAAVLLCLLLPAAAAAQGRTVYTDTDPATGLHLRQPVAVQVRTELRRVPPGTLAGLKAREYVAAPVWPGGPVLTVAANDPNWPLPKLHIPQHRPTETLILRYTNPWGLPLYGPFITGNQRSVHRGRR